MVQHDYQESQKILIFGATGMLGHTLFAQLSHIPYFNVNATARDINQLYPLLNSGLLKNIVTGVDIGYPDSVVRALAETQPDVVINCIGIIKQAKAAQNPLTSIAVNALWPHRLAMLCKAVNARLIHISTDCVFDGARGSYSEKDLPNATDLYGRTKCLGEVNYPHCLTLRTSIIGHELAGKYSLIEWFLAQQDKIRGFTAAIYSGFPTVELSHIIANYIIPNNELSGLYHISSDPISKYNLLKLAAVQYKKNIEIEPYSGFKCNRSLDSTLFKKVTGYSPPPWPELIKKMHQDFMTAKHYQHRHLSGNCQ